jgi:hypothetical protein
LTQLPRDRLRLDACVCAVRGVSWPDRVDVGVYESRVAAGYPLGFLLGGASAQAFGNEIALILGMLGGTPILILIYASSLALRSS